MRVLLVVIIFLLSQTAMGEENMFLSALYNPQQHWTWNLSKGAGYGATVGDVLSTTGALRRGYVEANWLDNAWIPKDDPAPVKRMVGALGIQYGLNLLFDWGYRKQPTRKGKLLMIGIRGAFTGMSIWAMEHNRGLR